MTEAHYKRLVAWLMDTIDAQAREIEGLRAALVEEKSGGSDNDQHS